MGNFRCYKVILLIITLAILLVSQTSSSSLSPDFYKDSCPKLFYTIKCAVRDAIRKEARMGASLLRLHFHDCFVNGCDASVLLDDVQGSILGEKTSRANLNSARGFDTIDTIKFDVEKVCRATVSCADILAIVARDSVVQLGGPSWEVKLGRKDSLNASLADANNGSIPAPTSSLFNLTARFKQLGLSQTDLVALSGSHTIGQAKCSSFRNQIYNDANINTNFATKRRAECPRNTGNNNSLAPLDTVTPKQFDNEYYKNLVGQKGLLHSDQELFNDGSTDSIVTKYGSDQDAFYDAFAKAMIKMGDIMGSSSEGQIRIDCRKIN